MDVRHEKYIAQILNEVQVEIILNSKATPDPPFLALILTLNTPPPSGQHTETETSHHSDCGQTLHTLDMGNQHIPHTDLRSLVADNIFT